MIFRPNPPRHPGGYHGKSVSQTNAADTRWRLKHGTQPTEILRGLRDHDRRRSGLVGDGAMDVVNADVFAK